VTKEAKKPDQYESLAQLWAQAVHDLRQPVQAALLLTKMLDGVSGPAELRRTARHLGTALESLYDMLEVLTLLSRVEAGLQMVQLRTCQLADVLAPTIREMSEIASERGLPVRFRNIRGLVRTNPTLLATATRSLLLNAMKFGNGNEVLTCCRRRGNQVSLEVHFGGASLDAASERNAFVELPARGDGSIASELGLGLALLERLCSRLGHNLQFSALPPDGQLLTMALPRPAASR
jgi:signal transduction histidine kinase